MKKILYCSMLFSAACISHAQSLTDTENYSYTKTYLEPVSAAGNSTAKQRGIVQYSDGLGRPMQTVVIKGSSDNLDIVIPYEYDADGRQTKSYLPVIVNTLQGAMQSVDGNTVNAYYAVPNAYSETLFEKSPLGRVFKQAHPGEDWKMASEHTIKKDYQANKDYEVKRIKAVATYNAATQMNDISMDFAADDAYTLSGYYRANTLFKNITRDEDDNEIHVFSNSSGQTLLTRKINNAESGLQYLDTYYVYDVFGNTIAVIPPNAAAFNTSAELASVLNTFCYQYRYDKYNRIVEKKLPGRSFWESIVYDKQDRVVLTQDAKQQSKQWSFTKYDKFGRTVYSGLFSNTATRVAMQTALNSMRVNALNNETRSTTPFSQNNMAVYYTKTAFPTGSMTVMSVNYYDTYPPQSPAVTPSIPGQHWLSETPASFTQNGHTTVRNTRSLITSSSVKNTDTDAWSTGYLYYDTKARPVATQTSNYLGGFTNTETVLDFAGVPQKIITKHARLKSSTPITVVQELEYDNQNRLLKHYHEVVGRSPKELLAENHYNELGQIEWKKVGGTDNAELQKLDYTYNIRGWLTEMNEPSNLQNDLFGYRINYSNTLEGLALPNADYPTPVKAKWNGSIAEVLWKRAADTGVKRYGYVYDNTNRLLAGLYQSSLGQASKEHSEIVTYDLSGNISTLKRSAGWLGTSAQLIDDLDYKYTGNRIRTISDLSRNSNGYEGGGQPFSYDANGNIEGMPDKGILNIKYNFLNLPRSMETVDGLTTANMEYLYRADGTKLRKTVTGYIPINGGITTVMTSDYLDGFQYLHVSTTSGEIVLRDSELDVAKEREAFSVEQRLPVIPPSQATDNAVLQFIATAEGFYDFTENRYIYRFKDHLGNTRLSYAKNTQTNTLEILDKNDYYPFGMNHLSPDAGSFFGQGSYKNHKYNGKELQETGMYDYGWRMYMPDIGRWNAMDQLSENYMSHSPYAYVMNNPVMMTDPDGRQHRFAQAFESSPDFNNNPQKYLIGAGGRSDSWNMLGQMNADTQSYTFNSGFNSLLDYFNNGGSVYGISNKNGYATFWTGGAETGYFKNREGYGSVDMVLHNVRFTGTDTSYKTWADVSATIIEGMYRYTADSRTNFYNSGNWIDNLGNVRSTKYAGRAKGSLIGLRSDYVKTTAKFGKYAERASWVGYGISAIEIGEGISKDNGTYGNNAQLATAKAVGGIIGAAEGALIGAYIGSLIPIPGVGTVLGIVAGAGVGYIYSEGAGQIVEHIQNN